MLLGIIGLLGVVLLHLGGRVGVVKIGTRGKSRPRRRF